jgi:hypothetical protein
MTVGKPEFNLNSFGITYVKKARQEGSHRGGDPDITAKPTDSISDVDIATSGFGDRQSDSKGDTKRIEGATQGGKDSKGDYTQAMTSSGKLGVKDGKKVGTEVSHRSGIEDPYVGQKRDASGNKNIYKLPESQTLPKNAAMQLAIIKCKLLKVKASSGDINYKRTPKGDHASSDAMITNPKSESGGFKINSPIGTEGVGEHGKIGQTRQRGVGDREPSAEEQKGEQRGTAQTESEAAANTKRLAGSDVKLFSGYDDQGEKIDKASWTGSGSPYPKPAEPEIKEKGTGDKIPYEKLGDLPQGKDDRKVESSTIVDEKGKERKYPSPADRYKAEVRKMAVNAIDEAMKNIETYQNAKEKALQEELIKDAADNTSDNGSVNFVYSDVKEKQVKKE